MSLKCVYHQNLLQVFFKKRVFNFIKINSCFLVKVVQDYRVTYYQPQFLNSFSPGLFIVCFQHKECLLYALEVVILKDLLINLYYQRNKQLNLFNIFRKYFGYFKESILLSATKS